MCLFFLSEGLDVFYVVSKIKTYLFLFLGSSMLVGTFSCFVAAVGVAVVVATAAAANDLSRELNS